MELTNKTKYNCDHTDAHILSSPKHLSSGFLAGKLCNLSTSCVSLYLLALVSPRIYRGLKNTIQDAIKQCKDKIYALDYLIIFLPALLMSFIYSTFRAVQTICYQQVLACVWTPFPSGMLMCPKWHVCALEQTCPQLWTPSEQTQPPPVYPTRVTGSSKAQAATRWNRPPGHQWDHPDKVFSALHISQNPEGTLVVQPYKINFN